ncbi:Hypothetical protein A7982_09804 [Minicystis rosea]|nr:Hypothetical protein A7982_09804 [Minicystis rosea]
MNTFLTRGYTLPIAANFVLNDEKLSPLLKPEAIDHLKQLAASKPDPWVPRETVMHVWSLVDECSPDEETAYQNLVRGGEAVAQEAIGTFLKLLLRVLSPKQFARKFPDIWAHEHKGGFVEATVHDENAMLINIRDVEGFTYIGPVAVGFVGTALRALGLNDVKLRDVTWTRANPGPRDIRIEISWS